MRKTRMGTRIPGPIILPPVFPGSPCPVCWGEGKAFGDGDTPESIVLSFSGISKGPNWVLGDGEPIDGKIECFQAIGPCNYQKPFFTPTIDLFWTDFNTSVSVLDSSLGIAHFFAVSPNLCESLLLNELDDHFAGGSCKVIIPGVQV
jgi:hypothetical protein